jgi:hypothetical protein
VASRDQVPPSRPTWLTAGTTTAVVNSANRRSRGSHQKPGPRVAGVRPYFRIPVFTWHAGRLTTIYQRAVQSRSWAFEWPSDPVSLWQLPEVRAGGLDGLSHFSDQPPVLELGGLEVALLQAGADLAFPPRFTAVADRR